MRPEVVKWTAWAIGISGAVVGGYYGVEALTNERIPVIIRNTIERELEKKGYTMFSLYEAGWQKKFEEFREGNNLETLAKILREQKSDSFVVAKGQDNKEGGKELKKWCLEVLDLEIEKVTENKSMDNAKTFCTELKTSSKPATDSENSGRSA